MQEGVAPTDSRRRPDMRLMENGDWAAANEEKCRLEQKQRAATRRYQVSFQVSHQLHSCFIYDSGRIGNAKYRKDHTFTSFVVDGGKDDKR